LSTSSPILCVMWLHFDDILMKLNVEVNFGRTEEPMRSMKYNM